MNKQREIVLTRYDKGEVLEISDTVVREYPFTICVNGEEAVTLMCSPGSLSYLTLGYLLSEEFIRNKSDVKSVNIDEEKGAAYVELSKGAAYAELSKGAGDLLNLKKKGRTAKGCSGGFTLFGLQDPSLKISDKKLRINHENILFLMEEFAARSRIFRDTGGVHGAALSDGEKILIFNEDIGRHNALDKVIGEAFASDVVFEDKIVLTTGRVSSEMLMKTAKRDIPVIVSRSAPMDLALQIADQIGLTVVGFVRGERMNVYTGIERIAFTR